MSNRRQHLLEMIIDHANKYKDKLTLEEFYDILCLGDCTGDGRLDVKEIKDALKLIYST